MLILVCSNTVVSAHEISFQWAVAKLLEHAKQCFSAQQQTC